VSFRLSVKNKTDKSQRVRDKTYKVVSLISGRASIISMDISMDLSMDIHIHGKPANGLGSVVSSPMGRPKVDFMHISGQREAIWNTLFSIIERWRGPQTSRGPEKLIPPFPPSRRAWS